MTHKITVTLDDDVYEGLRQRAGSEDMSALIEHLLRPLVMPETELEAAYREMAADVERESEALEWIEAAPDDALEG